MESIKLVASPRAESRKGPARRLRQQGKIPAVAYGKELPAQSLAVSPKDILDVLESEFGRNTMIELEVEGGDTRTMLLADFQYHPVTRELLHADFRQIRLDRPVQVEVPFVLTGHAKGVVEGGILHQVFRKLPISCLPAEIPAKIEHDVTELELDRQVSAGEVALPEGVSVCLPETQTVASVGTVKEEVPTPEEEEAAAAAEAAAAEEKPAEEGEAPSEEEPKPEQ